MTMRSIVVAGGSIAAMTAAETLRLEGFDGTITILSQESLPPYTRVPLSKGALAGREDFGDIALPLSSDDIELRTGVRAEGLDLSRRVVHTDQGPVYWDGLVIATGARARRLAPELNEYVVREHSDCVRLQEASANAGSALVVGGGFLGMEIASTLRDLGRSVTIVDREPPLQRLLGRTVAARVREVAAARGVRFHLDPGGVTLFGDPAAPPRGVRTGAGHTLEADLVISAAGDLPNVDWLIGSGLDFTDGGLWVDSRGRVQPGVVAAGDVAACPMPGGGHARIPSWTNAVDQARVAARALVRGDETPSYDPSYYFWTDQFGVDIKVSGALVSDNELRVDEGWAAGAQSALLTWGETDAPRRVLGWNHHLRPAQLKRMTRRAAQVSSA